MADWEAKAAVAEVLGAWSDFAGELDAEAMGKLMADDCEAHGMIELFGGTGPLIGPKPVVDMLARAFRRFDWLTQMNSTVRIELDADGVTARTRTNLVERFGRKGGSATFVMVAVYDDVLKLTKEGWRFQRRTITPLDMRQAPRDAIAAGA